MLVYVGILACNNIKETSNATKNEKCRMVDEEKKVASRIQAKGQKL